MAHVRTRVHEEQRLILALDYGGTKHTAGLAAVGGREWLAHDRVYSPPGADALLSRAKRCKLGSRKPAGTAALARVARGDLHADLLPERSPLPARAGARGVQGVPALRDPPPRRIAQGRLTRPRTQARLTTRGTRSLSGSPARIRGRHPAVTVSSLAGGHLHHPQGRMRPSSKARAKLGS